MACLSCSLLQIFEEQRQRNSKLSAGNMGFIERHNHHIRLGDAERQHVEKAAEEGSRRTR
jgi:hypothetical protein